MFNASTVAESHISTILLVASQIFVADHPTCATHACTLGGQPDGSGGTRVADVSAKRQGELIRGLFGILAKNPDGLPAREALARLANAVPPTPYEAADWPKSPGVRRFEKMVRFYTDRLGEGWLANEVERAVVGNRQGP